MTLRPGSEFQFFESEEVNVSKRVANHEVATKGS